MLLALLLLAAGHDPLVAVLEFNSTLKGADREELARSYFSDRVRRAALKAMPNARQMTRENMKLIAQTRGVDLAKCEGLCEVEIGQKLDADFVVSGDLRKLAGAFRLTLKLYDVQNGKLLASEEAAGEKSKQLLADLDRASADLFAPLRALAAAVPVAAPAAAEPVRAPAAAEGGCASAEECHRKALAPYQASQWEVAFPPSARGCELGDELLCIWTGFMLTNGKGTAPDPVRANKLFRKACAAGNREGCFRVAINLDNGRGEAKDEAKAAQLFAKACDLGHADACRNLAFDHRNGRGVAKDLPRANQLLRKACDGGNRMGCYSLALNFNNGQGVPKDDAKAAQLYAKSCELDYAPACHELGISSHD